MELEYAEGSHFHLPAFDFPGLWQLPQWVSNQDTIVALVMVSLLLVQESTTKPEATKTKMNVKRFIFFKQV